MAMTERSRNALFRGLSDVIDDEEAVGEMLAHFPTREIDEPATRAHVEAAEARLRTEIAGVRTEIAGVRTEIAGAYTEIAGVRTEIAGTYTEIAGLRAEIVASEKRTMQFLHAELRVSMQWTIATMVALFGVLIAALALS